MIDQATELRKLVLQAARAGQSSPGPSPQLLLLHSGLPHIGVTSLTVNLSVALAQQGARVVVVGTGHPQTGLAEQFNLGAPPSMNASILTRDIHECLQRGPAGIQVVPQLWSDAEGSQLTRFACEGILRQFRALGRHADYVLVDGGNQFNLFTQRCCQAADEVLLVTNPESRAVIETYARAKESLAFQPARLGLLVNSYSSDAEAHDVYRRISLSCRRFLALTILERGGMPADASVPHGIERKCPVVIDQEKAPAALAIEKVAANLLGSPASRRQAA